MTFGIELILLDNSVLCIWLDIIGNVVRDNGKILHFHPKVHGIQR